MDQERKVPLLVVQDLRVWFRHGAGFFARGSHWVHAVDDVSFEVDRGQTLGLVGESGCGKTTTGRAIVGLQRPTRGTIQFDGMDLGRMSPRALRRIRYRFQMIFQGSSSSLDPRQRVRDIVGEPLLVRGVNARKREERVTQLMELVGLPVDALSLHPSQFSGGQRQRIGIARALCAEPELLVCDEPVSALDVSMQAQIMNLLTDLQKRLNLAYVFISHDLAIIRHVADRVAVLYLGQVVETALAADFFASIPLHPYTVVLLSSVPADPSTASSVENLLVPGDPPSPVNPPSGCRFHPRCWLYQRLGNPEVCVNVEPQLPAGPRGSACHFADRVLETLSTNELTALLAAMTAEADPL